MYKYYNKKNFDIMEYNFDSISEFLDYLESAKTNNVFNTLESMKDNFEFTKTRNFEEAVNLCKYGYHENFENLLNLKLILENFVKPIIYKRQQFNDFIGFTPDVKAYLEGNPLSMINAKSRKLRHIDIYFNSANLSYINAEQIFNRGAITLNIIEILERLGYSVDLNIFTMSKEQTQIHYATFNLKKTNEKLNIQKLYFPMCHPSFLRRLVFRLREVTPDIKDYWRFGYGSTCKYDIIKQVIELKNNDIIICTPDELNVLGKNLIDDANNMFDFINNSTKNKDFTLEKIRI